MQTETAPEWDVKLLDKWDARLLWHNNLWLESKFHPGADFRYAWTVIISDEHGVSGSTSGETFEDTACMAYNWWLANRAAWDRTREVNIPKAKALLDKLKGHTDEPQP